MLDTCSLKTIHLKRYQANQADANAYSSVSQPYNRFYADKGEWVSIPEKTIYQTVYDNNHGRLGNVALIFDEKEMTFEEFFARADELAASLTALGVGQNDVVSVAMGSTPEAVCLLYAASKVGATFASMDPRDSANELKSKIAQASPKCLFVAPGFEKVADIASEGLVDTIISLGITVDESLDKGTISYDDFLRMGESIEQVNPVGYQPDHVAAIVYTGASTGAAKGVMLSDYSFNAMGVAFENSGYFFRPGKVFLDVLPLFIAYGVCNALHVPLMWGETIVLANPLRIDLFTEYVFQYRPQHVFCSPPHIRLLRRVWATESSDLAFLEMLASGGSGMPLEEDAATYFFLAEHGADGAYGQGYGMSEVNAAFCYGNSRRNKAGCIGIPFAGNDAVIVDRETLEELPFGMGNEGLLMLKTPTMMLGYHGAAAHRDAEVFVTDDAGEIWVNSGDICIMDESGRIKIVDRAGRGFNTFGMNMYPAVIENVVGMHPAVIESVAVGLPHENMGSAPVVNVVVAPERLRDAELIANELDDLIARELPSYTKIYAYNFRTAIPYTSRAKPDYQAIQSQGLDDLGDNAVIICEISDIASALKG